MKPPPDGWFDQFNGIRIPNSGSASSLEDLLHEVMTTKKKLGIDVKAPSVELLSLKKRLIGRNPSFYEPRSVDHRSRCNC